MEIKRPELTADGSRASAAEGSQVIIYRPNRNIKASPSFAVAIVAGLLGFVPAVFAATYYIDSEHGNDLGGGTQPATAGNPSTDGPWQTLGRLATAPLLPGDTVYLACGATWNETLRIASSGTSEAPIIISAGPGTCDTPPVIDGAVIIPGHMWKQHSDSIYRARLPIEYINNSALTENLNGWSLWSSNNDASMSLDSTCPESPVPCMTVVSGTGAGNSVTISNSFPLVGGVSYSASVRVKAAAGTRLKIGIRRNGPTYDSLTRVQAVTGSGSWQTVSLAFRATRSTPNARFDIEVPNGQIRVDLREAHVQRTLAAGSVNGVFVDNGAIRRAHHPNFERTDADPDSPYANLAAAGGKTVVDTEGLPMPANASLTPGLGVSIRTENFALEEREVASVSGTRLTLAEATYYSIRAGYGYFLTGALWMLDSPGEWYFNSSTGDLYVWMPDGGAPDNRVSISTLGVGVDLQNKAHVNLIGLSIRRVGTGARLTRANTVRLSGMSILELADHGIEADFSRVCTVEKSNIARTGLDAIQSVGGARDFSISDSGIADSGVLARNDGWRKLPRPARAAIHVSQNSRISGNQVSRSANNGMFLGPDSIVENNHVTRACLIFNDCGGIYVNSWGTNSSIIGNVVDNIPGGLAGLLTNAHSQTAGIFLDDRATGTQVLGNTVTGADYGVLIHNTANSTVSENILFGNRRYQIFMQEQSATLRAEGDIAGNRIESNVLVPVAGGPSVFMTSEIGDTGDFATFLNNHYSALISPRLIGEYWPDGSASHTHAEWLTKGQDTGSQVTQPIGYASFLSNGINIVPNGNLANDRMGWTWWNLTAPYAQIALLSCSFGPCLQLTANGSPTWLSSPNFSVTGEQWYRVTFDAVTSQADQPINVLVRRGGGGSAGYDRLMGGAETFPGSTKWRRYSFLFQAAKTVIANDPATEELGARVDFEGIPPGSSLTVARLEVVPFTRSQAALQLRLQLNPSDSNTDVPCRPDDEAANLCGKFVYMKNDSKVDWSSPIEALSGRAIYTRETSLVDADGDGVADVEDDCPETRQGTAANARGCGFDQQ